MQWLLHGSLASSVGEALVRHGHVVHQPADAGLEPDAAPEQVLNAARTRQWDLFTDDSALARAPFEPGGNFKRSIVFVQNGPAGAEPGDAVDRLFVRFKRLSPQRLYTVTPSRVKVRQLP
jgi:hypothetical protein